jgi:hypothetical protein
MLRLRKLLNNELYNRNSVDKREHVRMLGQNTQHNTRNSSKVATTTMIEATKRAKQEGF